jgi:hypothetical protein
MASDGRGDLALLVLAEPVPAQLMAANLARCGPLDNQTVRAYGHPHGIDDGVWAVASLVGFGGPASEWIQVDGMKVTGRRIEGGFSGAGVIDERTGAVVGLIVAEDAQAPNRVAWMMAMELVGQYLPAVMALLSGGTTEATPAPPAPAQRPAETLPERRLSRAEQRELSDRLWAVPGMPERSARDLYLGALAQHMGEALPFNRQNDDRLDAWAMIYALLGRPGATRAFVAVLTEIHRSTDLVAGLEEVVERTFPDLLLQHAERVELETLISGVNRTTVAAAYRNAISSLGGVLPAERIDVVLVIRQLETFGRLRGGPPPPLLVFADDLAHKIGGPTSVTLHRWIDAVGDRLEQDRVALRRLCAVAERRRSEAGQVYFVVQLQPDSVDPDRYLMSAWLQQGKQTDRPLLRDDVPRTLGETRQTIDDLLPTVPEHVSVDIEELTLEFIVPRRLLAHPIDQWLFDRHVFPRPLGIRYPVVVRSLERLRNRSQHDVWHRKSRWLAENGHRADPEAIACVRGAPPRDSLALYSELLREGVVVLAVPFPPGEADVPGSDEFAAALAAGLPVIVWSREPTDPAAFCRLVQEELAGQGVLDMPGKVLWLRRDAVKTMHKARQPSDFAPQVGLLWDDADRVPGSFLQPVRLQAPQ